MLQVFSQPLFLNTHNVEVKEGDQRASHRHINHLRRTDKSRNDPDQVRQQQKHKQRFKQHHMLMPVVADLVFRFAADKTVNEFEAMLHCAGLIHRQTAAQDREQRNQNPATRSCIR